MINVNRFADLGAPRCAPGAPSCTLRAALQRAQNNGNMATVQDRINLPAGTYTLSSELNMNQLGTDDQNIVIVGAGANTTFIQPAAGLPAGIRILTVANLGSLAMNDLTVRGGRPASGDGGNLLVSRSASLVLQRVRVTDGRAPNGGGIATIVGGALAMTQTLIDGNAATTSGGGLSVSGTLVIVESTVAQNNAGTTGGIVITGSSPFAARGLTVAFNRTTNPQIPAGGGVYVASAEASVSFTASIIAGNTFRSVTGSGAVDQPGNCSITPAVTDGGGNVEDGNSCKLGGRINTNPQLATTLDLTQQPPTLNIPAPARRSTPPSAPAARSTSAASHGPRASAATPAPSSSTRRRPPPSPELARRSRSPHPRPARRSSARSTAERSPPAVRRTTPAPVLATTRSRSAPSTRAATSARR